MSLIVFVRFKCLFLFEAWAAQDFSKLQEQNIGMELKLIQVKAIENTRYDRIEPVPCIKTVGFWL